MLTKDTSSVHRITEKNAWYEESTAQGKVEFLQSFEFGSFLESIGRTVWRLQYKNGEFTHQLQCVIYTAPLGIRFAYAPRAYMESTAAPHFLAYLKKERMAFLRIEPINDLGVISFPHFQTHNRQARNRWILNVEKNFDTILTEMHQKTRYNIHLAEKKGVIIEEKKDVELFWRLDQETTKRKQYTANPKSYYEAILTTPMTIQTNAYYQGVPIASSILLHFKDTVVYLFGASASQHRNVMAPALLQWYNIKKARQLGCIYYDFLGAAPPATPTDGGETLHHYTWDSKHPFSAVTRFKAGFGGFVRTFPPAQEIVLNSLRYWIFILLSKFGLTK